MYWTQWRPGRIERASMDGANRTIFVDLPMEWPSGLTIDHRSRVLYWSDMLTNLIKSIHLDGSNLMVCMLRG